MSFRRFVKDYLTFSKNERIAGFVIITLLAVFYLTPRLFISSEITPIEENKVLAKMFDSVNKVNTDTIDYEKENDIAYQYQPEPDFIEGDLFSFNPNNLPAEGWKKLGLNEKTTRTLINYRNKGGRFYKPGDLKKIWGMPIGFYERVKGYIQLPDDNQYTIYKNTPTYTPQERDPIVIDINQADTTAFISLPGIGSILANRIINFRNKLGGFHSIEQVGETYGLRDSTFQYIKKMLTVSPGFVQKININTVEKDVLKMHPYIKWNLANAIVEYRNQHGSFISLEQLKNIALIDEATFNKISPYFFISSLENE